MFSSVDTEQLKGSQEDDDVGPRMPHGERQVDKKLVTPRPGGTNLPNGKVNTPGDQGGDRG